MVLGGAFIPAFTASAGASPLAGVMVPMVIAGIGIVVAILGSFFVRVKEGGSPQRALNTGEFGASFIMAILSYFIITAMFPSSWSVGNYNYTSQSRIFRHCMVLLR
jgi:K(+)-stimulated pyrophosphate-energized sodium pump